MIKASIPFLGLRVTNLRRIPTAYLGFIGIYEYICERVD